MLLQNVFSFKSSQISNSQSHTRFIDHICISNSNRKNVQWFSRCRQQWYSHSASYTAERECCSLECCMYCTAYETIENITSGWELWGAGGCAVLWKWMRVWKKTRTVCGMYFTGEYVFSWDIWLHQLELLYCCCDKWLYSQFTFFYFSVLLECSLACSSPHVYFCHFSLLLPQKFPHLISCSCACPHRISQSFTKFITARIHSWSKPHSYPETSFWLRKVTTVSKHAFLVSFNKCLHFKHWSSSGDLYVCVILVQSLVYDTLMSIKPAALDFSYRSTSLTSIPCQTSSDNSDLGNHCCTNFSVFCCIPKFLNLKPVAICITSNSKDWSARAEGESNCGSSLQL